MKRESDKSAARRSRGRPPQLRKRFAVQQAMLAALAFGAPGRRRARKGNGEENVREAARRVEAFYAKIGRPIARSRILAHWYAAECRVRERPSEGHDQGIPVAIRVAARLLSIDATGQGEVVTAEAVLAWYRSRRARGEPALLHPFDLAERFHGEQKVSR